MLNLISNQRNENKTEKNVNISKEYHKVFIRLEEQEVIHYL